MEALRLQRWGEARLIDRNTQPVERPPPPPAGMRQGGGRCRCRHEMTTLPGMRLVLAPDPPATAATTAETDVPLQPPTDAPNVDPAGTQPGLRADFRVLIMVEGVETGDRRVYEAITWRDPPLPFMALDRTTEMHNDAKLVGNFDVIWKEGAEVWGEGHYVASDDPEVLRLQALIDSGELSGASADMDDIEYELVVDVAAEEAAWEVEPDADGMATIPMTQPLIRVTEARLMGATAVPFPAFALGQQITSLVATGHVLTAAATPVAPPLHPPRAWFPDRSPFDRLTPLTVTDDGRLYGHAAPFDQCHIGFGDRCVTPPRSATNYSWFLTGEIVTAEGDRVPCGQITMDTGHAAHDDPRAQAAAHYDHTGTCVADVTVGEDEFGVWVSGALRPDADPFTARRLMASSLSGDWRNVNGNLELVALLAVNVPGFPTARVRMEDGLVASLSAAFPVCAEQTQTGTALVASTVPLRALDQLAFMRRCSAERRQSEIDRLAARIRREVT